MQADDHHLDDYLSIERSVQLLEEGPRDDGASICLNLDAAKQVPVWDENQVFIVLWVRTVHGFSRRWNREMGDSTVANPKVKC